MIPPLLLDVKPHHKVIILVIMQLRFFYDLQIFDGDFFHYDLQLHLLALKIDERLKTFLALYTVPIYCNVGVVTLRLANREQLLGTLMWLFLLVLF